MEWLIMERKVVWVGMLIEVLLSERVAGLFRQLGCY